MKSVTLTEFAEVCELASAAGLSGVQVVVHRRCTGRRTMRVLPGLCGEVCCENSDGHTVVLVRCDDARRWIAKHSEEVEP